MEGYIPTELPLIDLKMEVICITTNLDEAERELTKLFQENMKDFIESLMKRNKRSI